MTLWVLVVDDEPALVRALRRLLSLHAIDVVGATDGADALRVLAETRVDVVVSDVRMPVLDGPGLLRALRERGDHTPVLFLTGYGDQTDADLRRIGAVDVLGKPVEAPVLAAAIRSACKPCS